MKVLPFKIQKSASTSLVVQMDEGLSFYERLHSHEDIQISVFEKGSGTYVIGNHLGLFSEGDAFIIGSQIPHVFKINDFDKNKVKMRSVFFTQTTFGTNFFDIPEMQTLKKLFFESKTAYKILDNKKTVLEKVNALSHNNDFDKIIVFLELIKLITNSSLEILSHNDVLKNLSESSGKRMDSVYQFIFKNFKTNIVLKEVADIAAMTKPAFCRYFKQQTNKTFVHFLNTLRIGEACHLLQKKEEAIQGICYKSGFNNLANFNRTFKAIKGMSPSEYRKSMP